FANALDQLRNGFYNKLWNLYGNVDWMNGAQLNATFSALSPANMLGETELLQDRQSRQLFGNVSDRLSLLGTGRASGMSFSGAAAPMRAGQDTSPKSVLGLSSSGRSIAVPMGSGLSGFVAMGGDKGPSNYRVHAALGRGQRSLDLRRSTRLRRRSTRPLLRNGRRGAVRRSPDRDGRRLCGIGQQRRSRQLAVEADPGGGLCQRSARRKCLFRRDRRGGAGAKQQQPS